MQARWGTHGDHPIVVLSPSSVLENYTLTVKAFEIADELRVPVIVLSDEITGHMRERVVLPDAGTLEPVTRGRNGDATGETARLASVCVNVAPIEGVPTLVLGRV